MIKSKNDRPLNDRSYTVTLKAEWDLQVHLRSGCQMSIQIVSVRHLLGKACLALNAMSEINLSLLYSY